MLRGVLTAAVAVLCALYCATALKPQIPHGATSRPHGRPGTAALRSGYGSWDDGAAGNDGIIGDAIVRKKQGKQYKEYKPRDDRDRLPYDVYNASPPRRKLGRFALDPTTGCGDMIQHGMKSYVVGKASCHYRFEGGAFKMFRKEADATELLRAAAERIAARMATTPDEPVYGSDDLLA